MAKVKRMMFGGAAKAAAGAVKSVASKVPPSQAALQKAIPNPMNPVKGQGVTGGPRPGPVNPNAVRPAAPKQFMSDALRKGTMALPRGMMKKGGAVKKTAVKKKATKK